MRLSVSSHGSPLAASAVWQQKARMIKMIIAGINPLLGLVIIIIMFPPFLRRLIRTYYALFIDSFLWTTRTLPLKKRITFHK